jgi:hypothetical protein
MVEERRLADVGAADDGDEWGEPLFAQRFLAIKVDDGM